MICPAAISFSVSVTVQSIENFTKKKAEAEAPAARNGSETQRKDL